MIFYLKTTKPLCNGTLATWGRIDFSLAPIQIEISGRVMPVYVRNRSPLAGGYKVGDTVVSNTAVNGLSYTRGSVGVGDVGVVLGPASAKSGDLVSKFVADADRRVSVQFKNMSGSINILVTNIHMEGEEPERVKWYGPLVFLAFCIGTGIPACASFAL